MINKTLKNTRMAMGVNVSIAWLLFLSLYRALNDSSKPTSTAKQNCTAIKINNK